MARASAAILCASYTSPMTGSGNLVAVDTNFVNPASSIWTAPMQISGGGMFSGAGSGTNDSVAMLAGSNWCANQTVTTTLGVLGAFGASELEHHLWMMIGASTITTYEIDFVWQGNHCDIVRWNGAQGNFTLLSPGGSNLTGFTTGDIYKSTLVKSGSNTIITVFRNGSQINTFTDSSPPPQGNPGVGGEGNGGTPANIVWTTYQAQSS